MTASSYPEEGPGAVPQEGFGAVPGYGDLVESSPDALLVVAEDGTIRMVNTAAERMFGYDRGELVGSDHRILLAEGFRNGLERLFFNLRRDAHADNDAADADETDTAPVEAYGVRRDGTEFQAEVAGSVFVTGDGAGNGTASMIAAVRDTSHRPETDDGLREAMSLLSATLESTADGILVVSSEGEIAGVNNQFLTMWGIPREMLATGDDEAVMGFVLDQLRDPAQFVEKVEALYADPTAESHDILEFRDGRTFDRYSRPQKVADQVVGRVWSFRDVTAAKVAQDRITRAMADLAAQSAQLKALAFRDGLTGLSNRQLFNDRLASALEGPRGTGVDVLLLDLDDFKEVNDILGHHAGDQMLIEVGRRLRTCVRPSDVVARLGGDEFVVLLINSVEPEAVAARIVDSLRVPVWIDGTMLRPSLSLGLASIGQAAVDASELLRRADVAMYAAKTAGKNRYMRFQPEMMKALVDRNDLEAGLRLAVDSGQIAVHYQPIVSAGSGTVTKVEALARWVRDGVLVPPQQFIPAAERSGLIVEIGTEVLLRGCTELKPWLEEESSRSLAVNVSGVQLQHGDFAELVLAVTESCGVDPRQLVLEVTESVFFEDDCHVIQQLMSLRTAGVRVALDDFGTGFSSLGRLQGLPVDTLKIDQSFVSMINTGTEQLPILNAMIGMAHGLGLTVTAEGVETAAQAGYLMKLECDSLQGFLFSGPQPEAALQPALDRAARAIAALRGERVPGNR
ncbi:bifunctional diguanylate cyclase/phosphodiesterase [Arthrobacter sp. ok362]|uniref:putative bifunctional diguanylate cyclase/phosphodiesterase n=1 Tax=Arthrobacter sp. ok362 TaxID=1761745 RepID=UPI00087FBA10|nr:EAL domain-containing protein [Arthrobacter sp. ok362]SDK36808.1 PAS domain S-box-containing protein/diguanylate cyclase (GGDEF) domain-containing protein [Arthrobacter sp. ok362]